MEGQLLKQPQLILQSFTFQYNYLIVGPIMLIFLWAVLGASVLVDCLFWVSKLYIHKFSINKFPTTMRVKSKFVVILTFYNVVFE